MVSISIRRLIAILSICLVVFIIVVFFVIKSSVNNKKTTNQVSVTPIPTQAVSPNTAITPTVTPTSTPSATTTPTKAPTAKPTIKLNIPKIKIPVKIIPSKTEPPSVDLNLKPLETKIINPGI